MSNKTLEFTYKDTKYTLEYTRKSIEIMEKQGFKATEIQDKPMTTLPALFKGAFLAHHKYVKEDLIDEIYSKLTNKQDLIGKLAEMYNEPIMALIDEPEKNEGNVDWTASW